MVPITQLNTSNFLFLFYPFSPTTLLLLLEYFKEILNILSF